VIGGLIVGARYGLLRDTAITDDENVYEFMARMWASGQLSAPSPPAPVRAFFDNQFIVNDGRWYGIHAPGHPGALTLGQWLGHVRWVTTIEAMLTVRPGVDARPPTLRGAGRIHHARAARRLAVLLPIFGDDARPRNGCARGRDVLLRGDPRTRDPGGVGARRWAAAPTR
jgi:hypothetical protein